MVVKRNTAQNTQRKNALYHKIRSGKTPCSVKHTTKNHPTPQNTQQRNILQWKLHNKQTLRSENTQCQNDLQQKPTM